MAQLFVVMRGVCLFLGRANEGNYRQRERSRERKKRANLYFDL